MKDFDSKSNLMRELTKDSQIDFCVNTEIRNMQVEQKVEEEVEQFEKKIFKEEKEIVALEKKIEDREDEIVKAEGQIFKVLGGLRFFLNGISKYEAFFLRSGFARRFSRHKLLYALTTVTSIVLVWRGVWSIADKTPGIANPIVSIVSGIALLWIIDSISELI